MYYHFKYLSKNFSKFHFVFFFSQRNVDTVIKMLVVSMDIVFVRINMSEMVWSVGVS